MQPWLLAMVEQIAKEEGDPYAVAHDLYRDAMTAVGPGGPNGEKAFVLYSVWSEFDDLASYLGVRTPEVAVAMRTAGQEWLALQTADSVEWRAYLDRWLDAIKALVRQHRAS